MRSFKYPLLLSNFPETYNHSRELLPWIAVTSRAICPSWCLSLWEVRLLMFLFVCWLDYKLCKDRGLVYLSSVMLHKMPFYSSCYEGNQLFTCTTWQHLSSEAPNASHLLSWHLWGRDTVPHPFWQVHNPGSSWKSTPYRKTHDPWEQELVYKSFLFWC